MILIDLPMPENCYECPIMMHCDDCEGYNNRCPLDGNIDCGYVVRRGEVVWEDRSGGTLWIRHPDCPLKDVVRCEDCRHYGHGCALLFPKDGYCYDGERKSDE